MIDKELKVGDCIYLPYSTLAHYVNDLQLHERQFIHDHPDQLRIRKGNIDYEKFHDDIDVNGNIYFCIYFIKPWGVQLQEINKSNGEIMLNEDFVKGYGEFVKHKECVIKDVYDTHGEVVSSIVTFEDEEEENQNESIGDKIDKAIDASLSASEKKMKADIEYLNAIRKELAKKQDEKVSHPSHYTWLKELCGIEVIDITRHLDFDMGNALKYLLCAGKKSEEGYSDKEKRIEDLKKAVFYIQDKIKMLEEEDGRD